MPHADLIILDEYHHCGARHWGTGVRRLLDANPGARIVGLSATPRRYGDGARDMTDELFDGRVASRMTLSEAWARRILPVPEYVIAGYEGDALIGRVRPRVERCGTPDARRLFERLRRAVTGMAGVDAVFARRLPPDAHVIVFCTDLTRLEGARAHAREWFGPDVRDYAIHSRYGRPDGAIRAFEADSAPGRKILYCVDMLNEGVHLDGVDAIVMLRATTSPHVYLQQLGRALDATGNRTPLVFDISDNYSGLGWLLSYGNPADAAGGADADAGRDGRHPHPRLPSGGHAGHEHGREDRIRDPTIGGTPWRQALKPDDTRRTRHGSATRGGMAGSTRGRSAVWRPRDSSSSRDGCPAWCASRTADGSTR